MRHYTRAEMEQVYNHVLGERMPGMGAQGIHELSTTKRYKTGSRLQLDDKVFHYGFADEAVSVSRIAFMRNPQDSNMTAVAAAGAAAAGATRLSVELAAGGGPAQDGNMPLNYLEGGTITFFAAAGIFSRGILTNTAVVGGGGGAMVITIDAPTPYAIVLTDSTEIIASRYARVTNNTSTVEAVGLCTGVGKPALASVADRWLWLQTWGPCWVETNVLLGTEVNRRSGFVAPDGSIHTFAQVTGEAQRAGTLIANAIGGGQGQPFFNLELDP